MLMSRPQQEHAMTARIQSLIVAAALVMATAASLAAAQDRDATRRQAWERQLKAQIDRTDKDIQVLESRLFALENAHAGNDASRETEKKALREQIQRMDHEQEPVEGCLEKLEHDESLNRISCPFHDDSDVPDPTPALEAPTAPVQPPAPAPPPRVDERASTSAPPHGPALRAAADPGPYEKAAGDRVSMFFYNPYRWVPVGTRQLAVFNSYDDAYLLDFAEPCPGLLTTRRIQIENSSTKVYVGKHAVIADGDRCPIVAIRELQVRRLPQ